MQHHARVRRLARLLFRISHVAFRLKQTESVAHGVNRLVRRELRLAIDGLQPGTPEKRDEAVHGGRKSIKKTRALLELVRPELGRRYRRQKRRLRAAAHPLSQERDAKVLLDTFDALRAEHRAALSSNAWTGLRQLIEAPAAEITLRVLSPDTITGTLDALDRVRADSRRWTRKAEGFRALRSALKRSFSRARKAWHRVLDDPSPGSLHRWRKRVKTHWYQTRLVQPAAPGRLGPYLGSLHDLETCLGDHHNLVLLAERINARNVPPSLRRGAARLCTLIEGRLRALRRKALALGAQIYAERSSAFVAEIERDWHAWRRGAA